MTCKWHFILYHLMLWMLVHMVKRKVDTTFIIGYSYIDLSVNKQRFNTRYIMSIVIDTCTKFIQWTIGAVK